MSGHLPEDKAPHDVHRLESFSDVVIGFCLAQIGLTLVLPKNATDVSTVWSSSTFFIAAFIVIVALWWLHHRIFSTYFVLNAPMVFMNFGMLGGVILALYFLESIVHVSAAGGDPSWFFALFAIAFAVVYALLAGMLLVGLFLRRAELPPADLRWGIAQMVTIAMAALFFVFAACYATLALHRVAVTYLAFAVVAAIVLVRRVLLPRWLRQAIPDAASKP
jgi:uncharacterized membrane protein